MTTSRQAVQPLTTSSSRARRTSFAFVAAQPAHVARPLHAPVSHGSSGAHVHQVAVGDTDCSSSPSSLCGAVTGSDASEKQKSSNSSSAALPAPLTLTSSLSLSLLSSMDATQREVACFATDKPLLVQAGAGSGKTQTMAMRIAVLLCSGVPARAILGICFTRQAAETLRERVHAVLPRELRASACALKLKTMHAFGLECLRYYGRIDVTTPVYDAAQQRRLAARVVAAHAVHTRSAEAVDELVEFVNRAKTRAHAPHIEVNPELQPAYLYRYYEHALHDDCHAVDFGDLLQLFLAMLRTTTTTTTETTNSSGHGAAVRVTTASRECAALQAAYTHLVVDEFQDLNEVQLEILAALAGEACRVTCVGDPNQCIYAWRGAVPAVFAMWRRRFPHTALRTLGVNYRSTAAIVAATNVVARTQQRAVHDGTAEASEYNNNKEEDNNHVASISLAAVSRRPLLVECDSDADELRALVLLLKRVLPRRDSRYAASLDHVAVLCRTRRRVQLLCAGLRAAGVPACEQKRVTPDGITCVRGLLAYVRLCVAPHVDADVQLALTSGALHLSSKAAKELFFSLDATQRDVVNNNNNRAHTTNAGVSYFDLLRQLVYDNFAYDRYPKLQMSKAAQKVVRCLVRVLTHAHDALARTPCDVPAVLRHLVREAGFERVTHAVSATHSRHAAAGGRRGLTTAGQTNSSSSSGPAGRRGCAVAMSTSATLAAAVAAEMSAPDAVSRAVDDNNNTDEEAAAGCGGAHKRRRVDQGAAGGRGGGGAGGCDEHEQQAYTPDEEAALLSPTQQSLCELLLQAYEAVARDAAAHAADDATDAASAADAAPPPPSPLLLLRRVVDELTTLLPSDNFGTLHFATADDHDDDSNNNNKNNDKKSSSSSSSSNSSAATGPRGSVTVTTVHQAKGMEWPAVILPGCWVGEYPVRAGSDEERRVFYVGMSRAMRDLVLVTATHDASNGVGGGDAQEQVSGENAVTADATTSSAAAAAAVLQRTPYIDMMEQNVDRVSYRDLHAQHAADA